MKDMKAYMKDHIPEMFNDLETQRKLLDFRVEYNNGNGKQVNNYTDMNEALVLLDRLTDYGYGSDATILFYQCDELVKYYHNRTWKYPKKSMYELTH
jgi:hypothetical protein